MLSKLYNRKLLFFSGYAMVVIIVIASGIVGIGSVKKFYGVIGVLSCLLVGFITIAYFLGYFFYFRKRNKHLYNTSNDFFLNKIFFVFAICTFSSLCTTFIDIIKTDGFSDPKQFVYFFACCSRLAIFIVLLLSINVMLETYSKGYCTYKAIILLSLLIVFSLSYKNMLYLIHPENSDYCLAIKTNTIFSVLLFFSLYQWHKKSRAGLLISSACIFVFIFIIYRTFNDLSMCKRLPACLMIGSLMSLSFSIISKNCFKNLFICVLLFTMSIGYAMYWKFALKKNSDTYDTGGHMYNILFNQKIPIIQSRYTGLIAPSINLFKKLSLKNKIFGKGEGKFSYCIQIDCPHNSFLAILHHCGIITAIVWFSTFIYTVYLFFNLKNKTIENYFAIFMLFVYFGASNFTGFYVYFSIMYCIMYYFEYKSMQEKALVKKLSYNRNGCV